MKTLTCDACISPCNDCIDGTTCIDCISSYYYHNTSCVPDCPDYYYNNDVGMNCTICA